MPPTLLPPFLLVSLLLLSTSAVRLTPLEKWSGGPDRPESWKHRLGLFFAEVAPDKPTARLVKRAMNKSRGREQRFARALEKKYGARFPRVYDEAFNKRSERRKVRQQYGLHVPRVTSAELARNKTLLSGHWPFVVTDAMDGWPANEKWANLEHLRTVLADEWVDYYKRNMYTLGDKPYLFKMREAVPMFQQPSAHPRYMQLRVSFDGWRKLQADLHADASASASMKSSATATPYLPSSMWTEMDWIHKCMPRDADKDNFFRVNQWNMMLIGEQGTGIFLHHDHLAASSWQAHVVGRKVWIVCPYDQSKVLKAGDLHTFKPDYHRFPGFADATCGRVIAYPGELLYYPAYWWHQTKCLDTPTIGITGLMVGVEDSRYDIDFEVHRQFRLDLQKKCDNPGEDISKKWPGAAPPISKGVCDSLNACFEAWDAHFQHLGDSFYSLNNSFADHAAKAKAYAAAGKQGRAAASLSAAARWCRGTDAEAAKLWSKAADAADAATEEDLREALGLTVTAAQLEDKDSSSTNSKATLAATWRKKAKEVRGRKRKGRGKGRQEL